MIRISESENNDNYLEVQALAKPNLPAVVVFYRSEINANKDKYGTSDEAYNGEFGFDRFDEKVIATGLTDKYDELAGVETKEPLIKKTDDHQYLCSFLSMLPPQGATPTEVTLYVKLKEDIDRTDGNPTIGGIYFESSDPAITIDNTQAHKIKGATVNASKIALEIKDDAKPIKIRCNQAFSSDVIITAKTSKLNTIGQLIIVANDKIYDLNIQPVYVTLGTQSDISYIDKVVPEIKTAELEKALNEVSLNQALIKCKVAPKAHTFTFRELQLTETMQTSGSKRYLYKENDKRVTFNSEIEKQYALVLNGGKGSVAEDETKKDKIFINSGTYRTMQEFIVALNSRFKYEVDASNPLKEAYNTNEGDKLTKAFNHKKVQEKYNAYTTAERKMNAEFKLKGISTAPASSNTTAIPKSGVVYLFFYPDIEASYATTANDLALGSVPGYTAIGNGISHIFKTGFDKVDAVIHEICHGLGLEHTFEESLGKTKVHETKTKEESNKTIERYEKYLEKQEEVKKKHDNSVKSMLKEGLSEASVFIYYRLDESYATIKQELAYNSRLTNKNYETYNNFKELLELIRKVRSVEQDINNINKIPKKIKSDIKTTEANILQAKKAIKDEKASQKNIGKTKKTEVRPNYLPQSNSMENYMDYDFDDSGKPKVNFKRKVITKAQWDTIRDTGLSKGYLK